MSSTIDQEIFEEIAACVNDPLRYVLFAFPWGEEGTPLAEHNGPRKWQREVLMEMAGHLEAGDVDGAMAVFRYAVSSGRGIGKSALVSMIIMWFMSCLLGATCIVTANTETQLRSRTWPELRKWKALAINGDWFDVTATGMKPQPWFAGLLQDQLKIDSGYYYAQAQTWSEENPDAFAGVHNPLGEMVIFDEASGIPPPIWVVTNGFFTEVIKHRFWMAFSNPRRNSGSFFDCFNDDNSRWTCRTIDSRTVEGVDINELQSICDYHGEDSDEARVEVRGLFPRVGSQQFISTEEIDEAMKAPPVSDDAPLVMGVDVARFGDDSTVFAWRRGRDGRSYPLDEFKGLDTMGVVREVAARADARKPRVIFVDEIGIGAGVVDRLKQLGYPVRGVNVARKPTGRMAGGGGMWGNLRIELYARLRDYIKEGGTLPADRGLRDELMSIEYKFRGEKQYLEAKEDMKKRGLSSPDRGDAVALTFAEPVAYADVAAMRRPRGRAQTGFAWSV